MARPGLPRICANCGGSVPKSKWAKGKRLCGECGTAKGIEYIQEMRAKRGKQYDKWRSRMMYHLGTSELPGEGNDNGNQG